MRDDLDLGYDEDDDLPPRRWPWVVAGLVALVAVTVGALALSGDGLPGWPWDRGDPRSASEGPEGFRTFEGAPLDLPASAVPPEARDVQGTAARSETSWTAAADFLLEGDPDTLGRAGDDPLAADGFVLRQRAYDDTTMVVIYDHEDGTELRMTYRALGGGDVQVTAVLTGP